MLCLYFFTDSTDLQSSFEICSIVIPAYDMARTFFFIVVEKCLGFFRPILRVGVVFPCSMGCVRFVFTGICRKVCCSIVVRGSQDFGSAGWRRGRTCFSSRLIAFRSRVSPYRKGGCGHDCPDCFCSGVLRFAFPDVSRRK